MKKACTDLGCAPVVLQDPINALSGFTHRHTEVCRVGGGASVLLTPILEKDLFVVKGSVTCSGLHLLFKVIFKGKKKSPFDVVMADELQACVCVCV